MQVLVTVVGITSDQLTSNAEVVVYGVSGAVYSRTPIPGANLRVTVDVPLGGTVRVQRLNPPVMMDADQRAAIPVTSPVLMDVPPVLESTYADRRDQ